MQAFDKIVAEQIHPSLWVPMNARQKFVDLSGNGAAIAAQGGLVAGGAASLIPLDDAGATDLDGSNDYLSTGYLSRRNFFANPSAEVDVTDIVGTVGNAILRDTAELKYGVGSFKVVTDGLAAAVGMRNKTSGEGGVSIPALTGQSWTASVWLKGAVGGELVSLILVERSAAGGFLTNSATNVVLTTSWQRVSIARTLNQATTAQITVHAQTTGTAAMTFFADGFLVEKSSALGDYFDGSLPGGNGSTWGGTAHASVSNAGAFTNGTIRGLGCLINVDSLAAVRGIMGGATNGLWVRTDGTLNLSIGGTDVTGNAGDLVAGTPAFPYVEFDEPNDTVRFYVNGILVKTVTGVTAQWATAEAFDVGRTCGIFMDGKLQHALAVEGVVVARDLRALRKASGWVGA